VTNTWTDSSTHDSHDVQISDSFNVTVVALAKLDGAVSGNSFSLQPGETGAPIDASNSIEGGSLAGTAGVCLVSQNSGQAGLIQQNVNVQANLGLGQVPGTGTTTP
jgi:hypothetical protein